ncbi:TPA: hypothetical protein RG728_000226 [Morganella morganii subsp. morganii]|uniref:hypothetical protein n=1 Tax=Morganella morganii TaxID=582 RepID=UPI0018FF5057|nr:hypothetical protein [Morganella morganii]HDU8691182.1 hypothetical protein [Morganella morganii subsp. morganii]EKW8485863.1 hypothetical protein [Morganella morganii]EKW8488406.1 hypothetical protein [Morganella morganii]HAT3623034.1 hypothetical protein [Morganella morganii]HCU0877380.1 hypothetical protein [Morganella morganii]
MSAQAGNSNAACVNAQQISCVSLNIRRINSQNKNGMILIMITMRNNFFVIIIREGRSRNKNTAAETAAAA